MYLRPTLAHMALRFDAGELQSPVRMPNGFLKLDAYLTRVGVFEYRQPDGSIRRELRPPEEVFSQDSLDSFALVPLTNDHPVAGYLTSENAGQFSVGSVGAPRQDSSRVRAQLLVTDAKTIADLKGGKVQISCGYSAEVDPTPGTWNGQRYDGVQRQIRGNHVAIVAAGRAGSEIRVRMDSTDAVMVASSPTSAESESARRNPLKKIVLDSVEFEIDPAAADAVEKAQARNDAAVSAAQSETAAVKAELAAAVARADAAEAVAKDAPAKVRAEVTARLQLEAKAKDILGESKFDGLDDRTVRTTVLAKLAPKFSAEGKSDAYVEARFDAELENFTAENPGQQALKARADAAPATSYAEKIAQRKAELANAHKLPPTE